MINGFKKELADLQAEIKDNEGNLEIKVGLGHCRFVKLSASRQQAGGDDTCML